MRRRILTAVAAAAIGLGAMTGTAAAADGVQVCRNVGRGQICVRVLESGAVVGVTICQGVSCIEYDVPQPV